MTSVSIDRGKVLRLTKELWEEQGVLDLDQIDGTYFIHACVADEIAELEKSAGDPTKHFRYAEARIRRYLPNAPQSSRRLFVVVDRPHLRDPVDLSSIDYGGRFSANGEIIPQESRNIVGQAWMRFGIRNREWSGREVAKAFLARAPVNSDRSYILNTPRPPYQTNEAMALIGATLYREGEYGIRMFWDPEREIPDDIKDRPLEERAYRSYPPEVIGEDDSVKILVDYNDSHWDLVGWPPMVLMAVAEPLPPASMISEFYDRVVIEQNRWHEHLLGAANGQSVQVAIRTWAIGLLVTSGDTFMSASRKVHQIIDTPEVGQKRFQVDRESLLRRAPEALPFFKRNGSINR